MIPSTNVINIQANNELTTSKTYLINFGKESIQGNIDGLEAVKQAIYMILSTERGAYSIYDLNYGVDLEKYIGRPFDYIEGDAGREIRDALLNDDRILDVKNFTYDKDGENILITFDVSTIYGELSQEVFI